MDIIAKNCTIAVDVMCALGRTKESSQRGLDGKRLAIRKNPHVIDVGFGHGITHN
jgi:hypothetical protein